MKNNWLKKAIDRFLSRDGREERAISSTEFASIIATHFHPHYADGPQPHPTYGTLKPWEEGWSAKVERPDLLPEGVVVQYPITDPKSEIEASNFLDFNMALPNMVYQIIESVRSNMDEWGCEILDPPRSLEIIIEEPLEVDLHTQDIWFAIGIAANTEWLLFFEGLRFLRAYPGTSDLDATLEKLQAERDSRAN